MGIMRIKLVQLVFLVAQLVQHSTAFLFKFPCFCNSDSRSREHYPHGRHLPFSPWRPTDNNRRPEIPPFLLPAHGPQNTSQNPNQITTTTTYEGTTATTTTTPFALSATTTMASTTTSSLVSATTVNDAEIIDIRSPGSLEPMDCADIQQQSSVARSNGNYALFPPNCVTTPNTCNSSDSKLVFCDLTNSAGGWTVIQRIHNNEANFNRSWAEFRNGFGIPGEDFWIGNEHLYQLTNQSGRTYELYIQVYSSQGDSVLAAALYDTFSVASEANNYTLKLGLLLQSGSGVDNLATARDMPFQTYDHPLSTANQSGPSSNCGILWHSGWWFGNNCHAAGDLNAANGGASTSTPTNKINPSINQTANESEVTWQTTSGAVPLRITQMQIRPQNFGANSVI